MVTITLSDGRKIEGNQEDFETINEGWSEYKLRDGTILRVKVSVSEIYRLDDRDPITGKSNFLVKSTNIVGQTSST